MKFVPTLRAPASQGLAASLFVLTFLFLGGCADIPGASATAWRARHSCSIRSVQLGMASWHAPCPHSRDSRTASERPWVSSELVAAHKTLPLGTRIAVINLNNGRRVEVKVIDRGPYCRGRIVDLSREAARQLDMLNAGTARVRLEVLGAGQTDAPDAAPAGVSTGTPATDTQDSGAPPVT